MKATRHALLVSSLLLLVASSAALAGIAAGGTSTPIVSPSKPGAADPAPPGSTLVSLGSPPGPSAFAPANGSSLAVSVAGNGPAPHVASPVVAAGWDALHYGTNDGIANGWVPPDVQVAAGPDHVVEMVNLLMGVYSKQGSPVSVVSLSSLFNSGGDFISDPKVQYDPGSARWFASVTDVTKGQVLLIVSTSTDPTLAWRHYAIPSATTTQCLDQPILGVGTTTVILSVNVFSACTTQSYTYLGAQYWVVNKTDLLAGASLPAVYASLPDPNEASIHPVQIQGSSDAHYMVSTYGPGTATTSNTLHLFTVSGTPPGLLSVSLTSLSMPAAAVPPAADQPGTSHTVDTSDIRVSDATWAGGRLWLGFDEACLADSNRACVRLVEIDTASRSVLQDFDVDVPGKHVFYPAFRLDGAGNLAVVVGYSSPADYPGLLATGRLAEDAPNTYQPPWVVVEGTGPESPSSCRSTCRYGDYFGAGLDPSDSTLVWLAGQMGTSSGWGTHVFAARVKAGLTFAYEVRDGGTGYSAPTLSYVLNGTARSTLLSTTPTSVAADPGSEWSVEPVLPGSTNAESWRLNASAGAPPAGGIVTASLSGTLVYFHAYSATFRYSVNGSTRLPVPSVTFMLSGETVTESLDPIRARWVDAGSSYAYENPIRGSTSIDRFLSPDATTGTVTGPASVEIRYYHQFSASFGFTVVGGGTGYGPPSVDVLRFGAAVGLLAPTTAWVDAGSAYSFASVLPGSGVSQRWLAGSLAVGTIRDASPIVVPYTHQYRLSVSTTPADAGELAIAGGWFDSGAVVSLAAASNATWRFQAWSGTGNGSYSGSSANGSVTMGGPISETAAFYPGLTIVAGPGGSVSYSYGSVSGTVPAGSSATIFVAPGTAVSLTATPTSSTDSFAGWSGLLSSASNRASVQVNGPGTVTASFQSSLVALNGMVVLLLLAVVAAIVLALVLRRRKRTPPS